MAVASEMKTKTFDAVTITFNPAIDRTLTISRFKAGQVNRVAAAHDKAGGKGVNVAKALADHRYRVAATGFLGTENAALFEELFRAKGIEDCFQRIPGSTRIGLKISDLVLNQTTDINFPGVTPDHKTVRAFLRAIETSAKVPTWFVIAGSLPPGLDPQIYSKLITRLKECGHKVLLDTSGEALRVAVKAGPNIIKPNRDELAELVGRPLKTEKAILGAAKQFITNGTEMVVVSLGERGACFVNARDSVIVRPPEIKVHSTVGAGDAMVAGIIIAQLKDMSLQESAKLATAFSLQAISQKEPNVLSPTNVNKWLPRIRTA